MRKISLVVALLVGMATGASAQSTFVASLDGDQENPPVVTDASGVAYLSLNADETELSWELNVFDITDLTAAHIHQGAVGVNGPVLFTLAGESFANPLSGTIAVTAAEVAELRAGDWYVNVHTVDNPGGEVRGQIGESAIISTTQLYVLQLSPFNEVPPPADPVGSGTGVVVLDVAGVGGVVRSGSVTFLVNYAFPDAVTLTGLHVHAGLAGENGGVVVNSGLGEATDPDGRGNVTFKVVADTADLVGALQDILTNPQGHYLNLHSSASPSGALRDQLR